MNRFQFLCIATCLTGISTLTSQEPEIEKLRPQIRFSEDFEQFIEGAQDIGSAPFEENWQVDPGAGSIQSTIAGEDSDSKQMVASGGQVVWVSPWIPVDRARLTKIKMTVTAVPNSEGKFRTDGVFVSADTGHDDHTVGSLFNLGSPDALWATIALQPGRQTYNLESLLGAVSRRSSPLPSGPTEVRLIIRANASRGSTFAFDDIQVIEEPFDNGELIPPFGDHQLKAYPVKFPTPSEENLTQPHLDLSIRFEGAPSSVANSPKIDVTSFGKDDIVLINAPELPIEFLRFEERLSSEVVGHYRIARPVVGWESLPEVLWVEVRSGGLMAVDGYPFGRESVSSFGILPPNVATYVPTSLRPVAQSDSFIDLPIQFSARQPIDVETLGDDDVYGRFGREKLFARLLEIQAVEAEGMVVRALFRLERPPYGWPYQLSLSIGNQTKPTFARGFPSTSIAKVDGNRASISLEPTPHVQVSLPAISQVLSLTDPQFEVDFVYVSEAPILLDSIGDGDVSLFHTGQPGRLVKATPSQDGREVTATFAFDRDLESASKSRTIGGGLFGGGTTDAFAFTLGGISDEAGSTYLGHFTYGPKSQLYFEVSRDSVTPTFRPRSQFHSELRSYRFGVTYQSAGSAIRVADFESPHFRPIDGIDVEWEAMVVSDNGHTVNVGYVASPIGGEWPDAFVISLVPGSIRDLAGGSHRSKSLVSLGTTGVQGGPPDTSIVQLVGGHLIEGDPPSHRLSFLTNTTIYQFDQSVLLFGGRSSMFAAFEESNDTFPSLVGNLLGVVDGIATFEMNRPDEGWGAWEANRLPYSLHLGEGNPADGGLIVSGHVTVHSPLNPLPLLFSFEEWVRQLERQAELPEGSLEGDADGDGVDSVLEYAMGSDLQSGQDVARITPKVVMKERQRHLELEFPTRSNSIGLQAEIQHSADGRDWQSVDQNFEVVERTEAKPGFVRLRVCSKAPLADNASVGVLSNRRGPLERKVL